MKEVRDAKTRLPVGFAGIEVRGGVEAVLFSVVPKDASQAPDERAGRKADGNQQESPAVKAHADFPSRIFQERTARAISRRKRMATAMTNSRAMRTAGWLWMACQFVSQD